MSDLRWGHNVRIEADREYVRRAAELLQQASKDGFVHEDQPQLTWGERQAARELAKEMHHATFSTSPEYCITINRLEWPLLITVLGDAEENFSISGPDEVDASWQGWEVDMGLRIETNVRTWDRDEFEALIDAVTEYGNDRPDEDSFGIFGAYVFARDLREKRIDMEDQTSTMPWDDYYQGMLEQIRKERLDEEFAWSLEEECTYE